jgi:hypothetical protein
MDTRKRTPRLTPMGTPMITLSSDSFGTSRGTPLIYSEPGT